MHNANNHLSDWSQNLPTPLDNHGSLQINRKAKKPDFSWWQTETDQPRSLMDSWWETIDTSLLGPPISPHPRAKASTILTWHGHIIMQTDGDFHWGCMMWKYTAGIELLSCRVFWAKWEFHREWIHLLLESYWSDFWEEVIEGYAYTVRGTLSGCYNTKYWLASIGSSCSIGRYFNTSNANTLLPS